MGTSISAPTDVVRFLFRQALAGLALAVVPMAALAEPTSARLSPGAQSCLDAPEAIAMQTCHSAAIETARNVQALLDIGEALVSRHRYREAVAVYKVGLDVHPRHRELIRRKVLAQSDWREYNWLGLRENRGTTTSSDIVSQLELIKCTTLRGAAAVAACNHLLAKGENSVQIRHALHAALREQAAPVQPPRQEHKRMASGAADTGLTGRNITDENAKRNPIVKKLGKFYALIIGNNAYQHFPSLETATADANAVAELLETAYGFHTNILLDADRHRIISELTRLRGFLKEEDNLLIYYAGHGYLDRATQRGYWLPVDAERSNPANWVSNADLNDVLLAIPAKRVLIVADSCYAGTLTPLANGMAFPNPTPPVPNEPEHRTRAVLTSGGLEPVLDTGHQGHSVFARVFLTQLRRNRGNLPTADLFPNVRHEVQQWTEQTPQFAFLYKAGHTGGDFVFARMLSATSIPREPRPRLSVLK